ncbi:MAG TPA: branched-chain amino acid ABC transporter permease [Thermoplasmata archaeon]|nr:branched-chain amino acid ABC transporter permease [Thermoplasmata archaeon]
MVELGGPLLDSLLLGSLYTMMALGLTITYKVTRIPNFSHAELVTVGSYAGVVAVNLWGRGLGEALLLAFVSSAAIALAADELVFKPLFRRGATPLHLLVASIGVGLVVRYVLSIFANLYSILSAKSNLLAQTLVAFGPGANLTTLHVWVPAATLSSVVALHLLFTRTRIGKGMRAMASNLDLARVSGIRTVRVRRMTWILAGGLAGIAGTFWSVYAPTDPEIGWRALLWTFAASILGGFVSVYGTIAGGYVVGASESFGITILNAEFGISASYKPMIALVLIVVVFLIRPTGFAGLTVRGVLDGMRTFPTRAAARWRALGARLSGFLSGMRNPRE